MVKVILLDLDRKPILVKEMDKFPLPVSGIVGYKYKPYKHIGDSFNIETEQIEMTFIEQFIEQ